VLLDGLVAPTALPECFLFDKNLKLVYHGAIDDNPSDDAKYYPPSFRGSHK